MQAKFDDYNNLLIRLRPQDSEYLGLSQRLRAFQLEGESAMLSVCQLEEEPVDFSAFLAYDIYNRRAQGVLNRSLKAAKKLGDDARKGLEAALRKDKKTVGEAVLAWLEKYRLQLAKLLSTTQLASLLEGAREVAEEVPTLATFPGAVPPPPSLEPKEAVELIEKLIKMTVEERSQVIYDLPADQQVYAQQAIAAEEAGAVEKPPPPFTPPTPDADTPEGIHFPVIDEAVKLLSEKNVMTKDKFDALDAATRAKSFTVANVSAEETLTKVRDVLAESTKEGDSYETFTRKIIDGVGEGTFMSEGHMENVFRTNIQSVFSDGQMAVLNHPLVRSGFPYARQDAIHDDRVEDTHLKVETIGIQGSNIFRINDPVFETFRAPWRWNCRCGWRPMTVRSAAESGITEAQEWLDSGVEPTPPAFVSMPDFQPPPGFQRAVGSMPLSIRLSMESVMVFAVDKKPEEEIDESLLMAGGGPITTGALDTAKVTRIERRGRNKIRVMRGRKKQKTARPRSKKWNVAPSVKLALDVRGEAHRGKGQPGGGQFTRKGVGEEDVQRDAARARGRVSHARSQYQQAKGKDTAETLAATLASAEATAAKADQIAENFFLDQRTFNKLKHPLRWAGAKAEQQYNELVSKYGAKGALAIWGAGQTIAWGLQIGLPIAGIPVVVPPGAGLATTAVLAAMVDKYRVIRRAKQ